jgi:DNA-binding LytR/AlgR family response regulator
LLKPIDEDELKNAVDKYHKQLPKLSNLKVNIDDIRKLLINPIDRKYKKRFTLKIGQHIKIIPTNEIECFYSENKSTYIHSESNRSFLIDKSLDYWQESLDPESFFRVNRTFIIHVNAIKDIVVYTNSRLRLVLNSFSEIEIIVSRDKVKEFKKWIDR